MTGQDGRRGYADAAEDATGFGVRDLRVSKDLVLRPRAVLRAYHEEGPTAGGRYPRPLRYFLALNGLLMLILFFMGGMDGMMPPEFRTLAAEFAARAGESVDAWIGDFDGWASFATVPLVSAFMLGGFAPLLKWWCGCDWRRAVRGALVYSAGWTLLLVPLSPFFYRQEYGLIGAVIMYGLGVVTFLRMGRGTWYQTAVAGVLKGLLLIAVTLLVTVPAQILVFGVGVLGATFGP